jgi:hypothetical protein
MEIVMKSSALFFVSLIVPSVSWGDGLCTQNPMQIDVCRAASTISDAIAAELPFRLNQKLVLQSIRASKNVITMGAVFDYTEDHLAAQAMKTGATLGTMKTSVRQTAISIACRPQTELQAFIELGGKLQLVYQFSDKAHFLTVDVDRCTSE